MRGRAIDLPGAVLVTAQLAASAYLVPAGDRIERRRFLRGFEAVVVICLMVGIFNLMRS